ncbi:conserved hypothetical protein [Rippkaea orientalis PCC 8801]|uniref:LSDAT prokaryote domain-containing protein n=1 Tax=Rippkaea orientalis (strain PCC 8801 / RF-1) TaxID=41431 RepID=B7K6D7_RIPO1|nr:hypothetical protein [Rippkaea orientalis]ACK68190.1 conserved hypothetical protein [Rippkaea orientalis PCC 8801]
MKQPFKYTFADGQTADVIEVEQWNHLHQALKQLGFHEFHPTLVLVGGASKISPTDMTRLEQIFVEILAPLAESLGVIVVDGGTDAGIMKLIGQARDKIKGTFPLIGVAALGTVQLPHASPYLVDAAFLAPHHTHFVLVPGTQWGDESPWLAHLPSLLSNGLPSVTLVVNGGEITWRDVAYSVKEGRPTFVLGGSGRTADQLASAMRGDMADERATPLIDSGLLHIIKLNQNLDLIAQELQRKLS